MLTGVLVRRGTSAQRAHSSAVELPAYNRAATGSNPVAPTFSNIGPPRIGFLAASRARNYPGNWGKRVKTMLRSAIQVGGSDDPGTDLPESLPELCGKWMPRKQTTCARKPGHRGSCSTGENMRNRRAYRSVHPHRQTPESRKKSARKARLASYGLTLEQFDRMLKAQGNACGMCHEPFEDGQRVHVDHDHACCRSKNRSCGKCVRGLLCHSATLRSAILSAGMHWRAHTWTTLPPNLT
jgi:hypothetical protein